jgi:hypothetical protein
MVQWYNMEMKNKIKTNKYKFALIAMVALAIPLIVFSNGKDESLEGQPPEFVISGGSYQGLLKNSSGLLKFTKDDEKDECANPTKIEAGLHLYYSVTDSTLDKWIDTIDAPEGNKMLFVFYKPEDKLFHVYPDGQAAKSDSIYDITEDKLEDFEIPAYRALIAYSKKDANFCDSKKIIKTETDYIKEGTEIPSLEDIESGWVLIPIAEDSYENTFGPDMKKTMKSIWQLNKKDNGTNFEQKNKLNVKGGSDKPTDALAIAWVHLGGDGETIVTNSTGDPEEETPEKNEQEALVTSNIFMEVTENDETKENTYPGDPGSNYLNLKIVPIDETAETIYLEEITVEIYGNGDIRDLKNPKLSPHFLKEFSGATEGDIITFTGIHESLPSTKGKVFSLSLGTEDTADIGNENGFKIKTIKLSDNALVNQSNIDSLDFGPKKEIEEKDVKIINVTTTESSTINITEDDDKKDIEFTFSTEEEGLVIFQRLVFDLEKEDGQELGNSEGMQLIDDIKLAVKGEETKFSPIWDENELQFEMEGIGFLADDNKREFTLEIDFDESEIGDYLLDFSATKSLVTWIDGGDTYEIDFLESPTLEFPIGIKAPVVEEAPPEPVRPELRMINEPAELCWETYDSGRVLLMPGGEAIFSVYKIDNTGPAEVSVKDFTVMISGGVGTDSKLAGQYNKYFGIGRQSSIGDIRELQIAVSSSNPYITSVNVETSVTIKVDDDMVEQMEDDTEELYADLDFYDGNLNLDENDWFKYSNYPKIDENTSGISSFLDELIIPAGEAKYLIIRGKYKDGIEPSHPISLSLSKISFLDGLDGYDIVDTWKNNNNTQNPASISFQDLLREDGDGNYENAGCDWGVIPYNLANPRWVKDTSDGCNETLLDIGDLCI